MTFKIFKLIIALIILPLMFIPVFILGALTSDDWHEYLDWWKKYFW